MHMQRSTFYFNFSMLTSLKCPSVQATNGILSREAYHNIENVGD